MFPRKNQNQVPGLMLLAGILGMLLRLLAGLCTDQRGLVPRFHPVSLLLFAVTVAASALAVYASWKLPQVEGYEENFPGSLAGGMGQVFAAAGIALTVLLGTCAVQGTLETVWKLLGYASIPCLVAAGWLRVQGKQPFFLLHLCPALFLVIHTVTNYRTWSSNPQPMDYLFSLFGCVSMAFFAFYHSAFDTGLVWRRRLTVCALTAVFLGIVSLPGSGTPWLYAGCALWALLDRPEPSKKGESQ